MTTQSSKLRSMKNAAPDQAENVQGSIDQVQSQIDELNKEIDAVQNGMCDVAASNLSDYLDSTKLEEFLVVDSSAYVVYGPLYGTIDYDDGGITDFRILDSTGLTMYQYEGVGWDDDTSVQTYIDDFAFGNDYLTRPLITDPPAPASYGLIPNRNNLISAKQLLQRNKNKVAQSETRFERYAD